MTGTGRRMAVPGLAAAAGLLLLVGVAGAVTIEPRSKAPGPRVTPTTATPIPPPPTGPPAPTLDLAAVVTAGPPGFDRIPDERLAVAGKVDPVKLVSEPQRTDKEAAGRLFQETRLVDAYVRAWQKPATGELVTLRLYQFADEPGARAYNDRAVAALRRGPATTFPIAGVDGAVGIDTGTQQGPSQLVYVIGRRARVVVSLAATLGPPVDPAVLGGLARDQLGAIPA